MSHNARALTWSLIGSMILSGSPLPSVSSSPRSLTWAAATEKGKEQSGGADAEREAGRQALRRGLAGEALVHLESALALYRQSNDKSGEAATQDLLGELYEQQGRYDVARGHYEGAYKIYTTPPAKEGTYNANLMLAKIGNMHYRQDDFAAASSAYNRMKVKKPGSKSKGVFGSIAEDLTAEVLSDSEIVKAGVRTAAGLRAAQKQFDLYRQTIIYAGHETGLGRIDYKLRQFDSAGKHFKNALSVTQSKLPLVGKLGQTRRFRIAARTSLGDVAFAQGRFKEAVELYDDAARDAKKEKRLDLMWPALRGLGRSRWTQAVQEADVKKREKLRTEALKAYSDALESVEDLRAGGLRADEARTTFLATTKDVFDEASSALAEMALMSAPADTGRPLEGVALAYAAKAFEVVERGRARSLLDLLNEAGANIREGVPPELFKRKQGNLDQQARVARDLLGVSLTDKPSKSVEDLEKEADELQNKSISIENEIRGTSEPRYKALTAMQPLTLAQVQQQVLDEGTALLEYSLGPEASYLFALTRDTVRLFKLPERAELGAQVDELRRQMLPPEQGRQSVLRLTPEEMQRSIKVRRRDALPPASAFAAASHKLYKSVLEPAIAHLGTRRLLIVPDGALSFIPFEALVTAPGGTDYAKLPYLVKTNETIYAPSASVVVAARREQAYGNATTAPSAILLIADPVFDIDDERAKSLTAGATAATRVRGLSLSSAVADVEAAQTDDEIPVDFRLTRLKGTRDEAERIAQTASTAGLKVETWLDLDASEVNASERDLKPYRVLHIATHGLLDAKRPQFTGIVLSLVGNKGGKDGFLRTDEIFNLRLGSPLVMLSACETGLGKETRGEGVMGLTRAFMYAGAPVVGVSLWSVSDQATANLMADFYQNLLAKDGTKPATAALRTARLNMIAGQKYNAPFYWAPFILVGDWR
ncbi:MAG TPA: CHAT domain-containing tetratricopeptide repeat protein [Pyrinomonadaceae bacterium]